MKSISRSLLLRQAEISKIKKEKEGKKRGKVKRCTRGRKKRKEENFNPVVIDAWSNF